METIGSKLRGRREALGLSVEEVAFRTRIKTLYIEAIERDDSSSVPGGFFYRSFIRQYAHALALPEDFARLELETMIRDAEAAEREKEALPKEPAYHVPPIRMEGVLPTAETKKWVFGVSLLATVVVICSLAYAVWERYRSQAAEAQTETRPQPQAQAPAQAPPVTEPPKTEAASVIPENATPPATTPVESAPPVASPAPLAAIRLVVKATEDVWVEVHSGGQRIAARRVRAGTAEAWTSEEPIRLKVGNAGNVQIEYNGSPIAPLGPKGSVRTVRFRKDGYDAPEAAGTSGTR